MIVADQLFDPRKSGSIDPFVRSGSLLLFRCCDQRLLLIKLISSIAADAPAVATDRSAAVVADAIRNYDVNPDRWLSLFRIVGFAAVLSLLLLLLQLASQLHC